MVCLIQQTIRYAGIPGQSFRHSPVARGPRHAVLALDEQACGDACFAPVRVHQAIEFMAEIQRFHSTVNQYANVRTAATLEFRDWADARAASSSPGSAGILAGGFRCHAPAGCQRSKPQLSGLQFMSLMQPWADAVHPEVVGDGCGRRAAASPRRSGAARSALRALFRPLNANVRS